MHVSVFRAPGDADSRELRWRRWLFCPAALAEAGSATRSAAEKDSYVRCRHASPTPSGRTLIPGTSLAISPPPTTVHRHSSFLFVSPPDAYPGGPLPPQLQLLDPLGLF